MRSWRAILAVGGPLALLVACAEPGPSEPTPEPTPVPPREVTVTVTQRGSDAPIADAFVEVDGWSALTDAEGLAVIWARPGTSGTVEASEHEMTELTVPADGGAQVALRPTTVRGTVVDDAGAPIEGVRVFAEGAETWVRTEARGGYELRDVPADATLIFKRGGFRLGVIEAADRAQVDVALEPFEARALYAPAATFETAGRLDALLALLEETEANALVIDVKETEGRLFYATDLETAAEVGAVRETPIFELEELLPMLRDRGIYTIARMVVMKDNTLAAARPELAVNNVSTGEAWRDNLGGAWLDPSAPGVAEYVASIAGDLADKGFDEVQLDYIRFYSDGPYAVADPNLPNTQSFRLPAVQRVVRVVSDRLATTRAFLAADVFPISFILSDDQGIGQRPEVVMPYLDYACPMAYPSHYGPGVFGFEVPNDHPYEVVFETLAIMNEQRVEWPVALRPWIQDFGYGRFPPYRADQVREQIEAAADQNSSGWMIWNPQGRFTAAALGEPRPGEDVGPITEPIPAATPSPRPS